MSPFGKVLVQALAGAVGVVLLWSLAAASFGSPQFLAGPAAAFEKAGQLLMQADYHRHVAATFSVLLQGFVPAAVIGTAVAGAIAYSNALRWIFGSLALVLAAAPLMALGPQLVLIFGIAPTSRIVLVFAVAVFTIINAIMIGVRLGPQDAGPNRTRQFMRATVAALRQGLVFAVTAVVVMEFLASNVGLGYTMMEASSTFQPVIILASFVILTVPILIVTALLQAIEEQLAG